MRKKYKRETNKSIKRIGKLSKFAIKVSIMNMIGYSIAVGIPTSVDPLLKHSVYGFRTYFLGYWVFSFAFIALVVSYLVNIKRNISPTARAIWTFLGIVLPCWGTLFNFLPEFPHPFVFFYPMGWGIICALASYAHIEKHECDKFSLEQVKKLHEAWTKVLWSLIGAWVTVALIFVLPYLHQWSVTVIEKNFLESLLVERVLIAAVIITLVPFVGGVVIEMVHRLDVYTALLKRPKRKG